ncbi:hypothetical protein ACFW9N_25910 [Streptomyces sp. NPDC059496]|uniref:hypothetical protein n=1 Tax=Streptomyces sp. NPDC059496 TaxID=3346851 RepID=UPI00369F5FAA
MVNHARARHRRGHAHHPRRAGRGHSDPERYPAPPGVLARFPFPGPFRVPARDGADQCRTDPLAAADAHTAAAQSSCGFSARILRSHPGPRGGDGVLDR